MRKRLNKKLVQRMVSQPESGMGYQKVVVSLKNGKKINGLVYDSEILEVNESNFQINEISDIEVVN